MKTKIEIMGFEIEIEEKDGCVCVEFKKDDEIVEEVRLEASEEEGIESVEMSDEDEMDSEEDMKDFDSFFDEEGSEEDMDTEDMESEDELEEGDMGEEEAELIEDEEEFMGESFLDFENFNKKKEK